MQTPLHVARTSSEAETPEDQAIPPHSGLAPRKAAMNPEAATPARDAHSPPVPSPQAPSPPSAHGTGGELPRPPPSVAEVSALVASCVAMAAWAPGNVRLLEEVRAPPRGGPRALNECRRPCAPDTNFLDVSVNMPRLSSSRTTAIVVVVTLAVVVVAGMWWRRRLRAQQQRREGFWGALIGLGITGASVGLKASGADKKIADAIFKKGGPKVEPTYRGRYNDGIDWVCPDDTVETGMDDSKACITSPYHPPVWKAGPDGKWAHLCPNGTTETAEKDWNKKCAVGWMTRVYSEDTKKWACPWGTTDSGRDWDAGWHEGQKQCQRGKAYTTRLMTGGKWACPAGSKDTGKGWDAGKENGWKQCKWTGP